MSKHTPGPWYDWEARVWLRDPQTLLDSYGDWCLVAAAPDMLAALHQAFAALSSHDPDWPYMRAIRAAIAKAEGRS